MRAGRRLGTGVSTFTYDDREGSVQEIVEEAARAVKFEEAR